ncbi:hypothetical protein EV646_102579 [Kribbella antiqua]|uniref:Uncharacterized protein n=1 Tax=Kribbella antiqua TaxID=2512217 RepID=A0A4R2J5P9_9ACTN|nr:hypothetical protein [Kribbella antiqua]TCO50505.1 hypothetical protein EV646_102579 [Kribbella antiqua]
MNGRTAQESRLPVKENGTAAANGTNGHATQPEPHLDPVPVDETAADPIAEKPEEHWTTQVASDTRVNGTAFGEFNTPVRVDEIALAAMALSENLEAATRGMPETVELRRFRRDLDQAASTFRALAGKLEATAGGLVRLAANEGQSCGVGWGVCPEHGLTLMNVGESVSCRVLGCHLENEGAVERCEHPVAYRVVDAAGPALLTCAGHAIACRLYFENAVITLASDSLELF